MTIDILRSLWKQKDDKDHLGFEMAATDGDMGALEQIGAEHYRNQGIDPIRAQELAEQDVHWAEGQEFLETHPKPGKLPWSGKRGKRG